jgi:glycerate-2-kinase
VIVASNRLSLQAALSRASALGFESEIFRSDMVGDVHEVARDFASRLEALSRRGGRPKALLAGGELTLAVRGSGRGGRNQELALVCARHLEGTPGVVVLSAGTDGTDGPTDAAGAFADGDTWDRARRTGLDPESLLADNDSYRLFDRLGDLLKTGPTGTNVNDLVVGLVAAPRA